jgi:DNA-binding response OmpR family regulator
MSSDRPTVLVVDDDRDLAETCAIWLDDYDVRTAFDGEQALAAADQDVDVALLDRRMPDLSGDDVLARWRDRGIDCQVSMLTAVEPDAAIIDMSFDAYLVKPVSRSEILETVADLLRRDALDDELREFFALSATLGALESRSNEIDQARVDALRERIRRKRAEVDDLLADLDFEVAVELAEDA